MLRKLLFGVMFVATTSFATTDEDALIELAKMSGGNPGCIATISKLINHVSEESADGITFHDFVFNPSYNKLYKAIESKELDPLTIYETYKYTYNEDLSAFINFLLD